jgi:hypothetical protein
MRARIKVKVDVEAIGLELHKKEVRRRELITERLREIISENNITYQEAKKLYKKQSEASKNNYIWSCIAIEMRMV